MNAIVIISEAINANVLVNARGENSLPSAACSVNTGRKLTMVVLTAVRIAGATSAEASYMVSSRFFAAPAASRI